MKSLGCDSINLLILKLIPSLKWDVITYWYSECNILKRIKSKMFKLYSVPKLKVMTEEPRNKDIYLNIPRVKIKYFEIIYMFADAPPFLVIHSCPTIIIRWMSVNQ